MKAVVHIMDRDPVRVEPLAHIAFISSWTIKTGNRSAHKPSLLVVVSGRDDYHVVLPYRIDSRPHAFIHQWRLCPASDAPPFGRQ